MDNQRKNRNHEPHTRNAIADLWRLGEVDRWQIVRTTKSQNVAEHSFMVVLLSLRLAESVGTSRDHVMCAALLHDAEEAWTGDIPSPVKQFVDTEQVPKSMMLGDISHLQYSEQKKTNVLVKIADLACDIKFLMKYGDGSHALQVENEIRLRLFNFMGLARTELPQLGWDMIEMELDDFWHGEETHLDDYLKKA